jgi:hypothetical protein
MGTYNRFKSNRGLEKDGVLLDLGESGRFRIARAGGSNARFKTMLEREMRPYRSLLASGAMDESMANPILIRVFAESVVLGWTGVTDENGNDLPFSKDACIRLLGDLPDLFAVVREAAMSPAPFRETLEQDAKN